MTEGLMAGLTSVLAVACIYWSWCERGQAMVAATGWLLALGSAVVWSHALGPEFGVTYAMIVFMCLTWLVVLVNTRSTSKGSAGTGSSRVDTRSSESRVALRPYQTLAKPQVADIIKHGGLFMLSVPVTGVLTLMLSVAAVLYLPWTLLNKIAVAIFLWPVLWGALSAWIGAQKNIGRPVIAIAVLFLISGLALFI